MDPKKAEKIAAAKKKLKQFQQKGRSKSPLSKAQQEESDGANTNLSDVDYTQEVDHIIPVSVEHVNESLMDEKFKRTIEDLMKEKNGLIALNEQSKKLIRELETNLDEERQKSASMQSTYFQQKEAREEELKNTISILIEEKNYLTLTHSQCHETLKKVEDELEEHKKNFLTLQQDFLILQKSKAQDISHLEVNYGKLAEEYELVKAQLATKSQHCEELSEELKELHIRYGKQTTELGYKTNLLEELNSQIELLNVNMQQLKNAGLPPAGHNSEVLHKENDRLVQEIDDLRKQLNKESADKQAKVEEFKQYIMRLNDQIRAIKSQAESVTLGKRQLEAALEAEKEHAEELKATVTNLQKDRMVHQADTQALPSALLEKTALLSTSEPETAILEKKINEITLDNDQLAKLVLEKESRIQELEIRIDRLQSELKVVTASEDPVQKEKLYQAMQSDKSAASRAIAQNRQLKSQLEELEKAFIQLSNDKLALTEQSQEALRHNKEMSDRLHNLEPECARLRQQVEELAVQRDATIFWKQELEEAHERIQALSHQNAELKKRVIWNLSEEPSKNSRQHRHCHGGTNEHHHHDSSSSDCDEEPEWVSNEEHQKLRFHYSQLEQQYQRSVATIASITEEKQKLEHLVTQLQSETETIGEYVSLYQVQRGLLRRRAEQLAVERRRLKERIDKLTLLLPRLAPQLANMPQWLQLKPELSNGITATDTSDNGCSDTAVDVLAEDSIPNAETPLDEIASNVVKVLLEMISCKNEHTDIMQQSDAFNLDTTDRTPHENFHPCLVCSGRLMTV